MDIDQAEIERLFGSVSPGGPENSVGFVMWRVSRRYLRELDHALAHLELTHLKFHVLTLTAWLSAVESGITQARLATFSDIQPMQVSLLLRALEKGGLITRTRGVIDTRAKVIELTTAGWQALREALPIAIEEQARFFGDASRPDAELLQTLRRLDQTSSDRTRAR